MSTFNLAKAVDPGENRLWNIEHRPTSQKTPVRLELRQRTIDKRQSHTPLSFTKVVGYIDTIADETHLKEAAETLLIRVGKVDQFTGVHEK